MSEALEVAARAHCAAGEIDDAIRVALQAYGDEVFSFLVARLRDEDDAGDVFSQACEDLLHSLPTFAVAVLAAHLVLPARAQRRGPLPALPDEPRGPAGRAVATSPSSSTQVRSRTVAHLRREVKDGMRALREQLDADEQQLLLLRVDRDLSWNEIAEILARMTTTRRPAIATSARLRQQFQKLKDRLRELAIAQGLIEPDVGGAPGVGDRDLDTLLAKLAASPQRRQPLHLVGTRRFELRRQLGSGAFGDVYEARDREHGTLVALKSLKSLEPGLDLSIQARVPDRRRSRAPEPRPPVRAVPRGRPLVPDDGADRRAAVRRARAACARAAALVLRPARARDPRAAPRALPAPRSQAVERARRGHRPGRAARLRPRGPPARDPDQRDRGHPAVHGPGARARPGRRARRATGTRSA